MVSEVIGQILVVITSETVKLCYGIINRLDEYY